MKKYVMAIDQGTTSSRVIIFDKKGQIVSMSQREIEMIYQSEDFVEQDAYDIWTSVLTSMADALLKKQIMPEEIMSIGITNQRETTIVWDRRTGIPIYKAIVWQSKQSNEICERLKQQGYQDVFQEKTGLLIDPYFSATKIKWVLEHVAGAQELMESGNLMFGTVDTWLLYKLSGQLVHKTDFTNASRTLLFNINTLDWDEELLSILGIDRSILPEICDSNAHFADTIPYAFFGEIVPITGVLGDQQAALFGHLCVTEGEVKNTYGTGCFMLMNTGDKVVKSKKGLLTTIAYSMNGKVTYALEGSVFIAGSAIQWLRDSLGFFTHSKDSEQLANSVENSYGVFVVPAFAGLGTPYWDSECKGAIFGITRGTTKAHITRATLESLAYQTRDIIDVMSAEANLQTTFLKVDGGASENNYLMQFQSNLLHTEIIRPSIKETTALGAFFMSGLSSGFFESIEELQQILMSDQTFSPLDEHHKFDVLYEKWLTAIKAARTFKF